MEIGFIGLGRMGNNMVQRLLRGKHKVTAYDLNPRSVEEVKKSGAGGAESLEELVRALPAPRRIWLMLPAGNATESTVEALKPLLSSGDTVLDGGNSNYRDSIRRGSALKEAGINFIDVGTSGGVWGLKEGYCLMVGGEKEPVSRLAPLFKALAPAPDQGWGHVGPAGAGHFVKMVHNGIEYGMMEAYAEGFAIMKAKKEFGLDLAAVSDIWRRGSVIRSWLLDLTAGELKEDADLSRVRSWVDDSGEGRWTVAEAIDLDVSAPVITHSLLRRLRSREKQPFADKVLAAMRRAFGGHKIKKD